MDSKPYLIFNQGNLQYGIEARLVKEIFPLPELTSVPEAPTDIIGILNLRGEVLPIMHLALRLGRSAVKCQLSDQIVVLDWRGLQIGMLVDRVQELQTIEDTVIQARPEYGRANNINPAFIAGIAKLESELIVLLDPETLIRQPDEVAVMIWEGAVQQADEVAAIFGDAQQSEARESQAETENVETKVENSGDDLSSWFDEFAHQSELAPVETLASTTDLPIQGLSVEESVEESVGKSIQVESLPSEFDGFYARYCPHATVADREIFQRRAESLRLPLVDLTDSTGLYPLAVVEMGGESFGIDLKAIQEFTSIRNLTHIPCCPGHIVGNTNLRGEIVTLVDIRSVLNLSGNPVKIGSQTVVVQVEEILAGLPVDRVSDVLYVNPAEIKPVPIAVPSGAEGYLQGTVNLFGKTLSVLDLTKLLAGEELVVNETA